ncbi:MAG: citrate transporter [Oscillospiraceae bacterium]|nr:citrate transporter [Oscillospiraceae bacterium]
MARHSVNPHPGAGAIPALYRLRELSGKLVSFAKSHVVMMVALLAAAVTSVIVPVDGAYLGYFDFKTLACLFSVLAVVCALKNIQFFYILAQKIVQCFCNARLSVLALVYITFIGSMLIANDMALLTFLPLGWFVLSSTGKEKYAAFTFIMQNIAANLGGMLTPFGNPQNLYLYTKFTIPNVEFMGIMLLPFVLSVVLITVCCLIFVKPEPLVVTGEQISLPVGRTVLYLVLFALSIAIVFRGIPYWLGLVIIPAVLYFADRKSLKMVDYPLLLTFVFFFIFSGNMARIPVVRNLISTFLEKNTLLFSVLSCQFISNVPSAILLSQFTGNYADLLVGVNIGGTGTLIASLASLITFTEYTRHFPEKTGYYVKLFSLFNFGFLAILTAVMLVV